MAGLPNSKTSKYRHPRKQRLFVSQNKRSRNFQKQLCASGRLFLRRVDVFSPGDSGCIEVQRLSDKVFFRAEDLSKSNMPAAFFKPFRFKNHIHLRLRELYI